MLQNNEKTAEVLKAEKIVEQAKARLAEAKRKASQQKRKEEKELSIKLIVNFIEKYQFGSTKLPCEDQSSQGIFLPSFYRILP